MNWSNGAVASSRHCPSALIVRARRLRQRTVGMPQPLAEALQPEDRMRVPDEPEDRGEQDGGQRDQQPGAQLGEVVDQRHRRRRDWLRLRRWRGLSRLTGQRCARSREVSRRSVRRARAPRRRCRATPVVPRCDPAGRPPAGRPAATARARARGMRQTLRLAFALHLPDLGLEDAHRLAQRARRVGELLGTEQHDHHDSEDHPVPRAKTTHFDYLQTSTRCYRSRADCRLLGTVRREPR